MKRKQGIVFGFLVSLALGAGALADTRQLVVSTEGNDSNPGTVEEPVKTLYRARDLARELPRNQPISILVAGGDYYLDTPLVFTATDSGTQKAPVFWKAMDGETVRLVGGKPLTLKWEKHAGKIYKATVPEGIKIEQLFVNRHRQIMARYPNYDPESLYYCGSGATDERMKSWKNPETAYIHAMQKSSWGSGHAILKRDEQGELYEYMVSIDTTTRGDDARLNQEKRFAENVFEELDDSKEWFHDTQANLLYWQPEDGCDPNTARVEAIGNPHLIRFEGGQVAPVQFITFNGFTISGAAPTWKWTLDHLPNGGDFVVHRGGAITFEGAEDCTVENCSFIELGGNAVFINGYNRRVSVIDCLMQNIGANGVALCGAEETMRGDQFFKELDETLRDGNFVRKRWEKPEGWFKQPEDLTPGPKTENYPAECLVKGNLVTVSGEYEKQSAAVLLSMTRNNTISHNTVHKLPRAAICMNDCSWSGNVFEYNDLYDTVRETADHGPFNSWGKDRYWIWADHSGGHDKNPHAKENCLIDAMETNIIRHNRVSHPLDARHSHGIDLDDGSTNFRIYNNLTIGCGIKVREGFYRTVENNVMICVGRSVPTKNISFDQNEDVWRRNIVVNLNAPMFMTVTERTHLRESKQIDYNCFFYDGETARAYSKVREPGVNVNSIVADPMFVNPAEGDYRVKDDSPALKLGFKNFPMNDFGVTSPRLIQLLPKRTFPQLSGGTPLPKYKIKRNKKVHKFFGGTIRNMATEIEMSNVGIGEITGVLVVKAPENSSLYEAGFRNGDLIINLNEKKVHDTTDLFKYADLGEGAPLKVQIHDDSGLRIYTLEQ
ncbi:hypothetical protein [Pontiella sulfatireligans]|uniref:PDZ domain-containing protein n=1 Tax=Pontiella sulfatireligans TaxID=2750658 RepID=A0A6C2UDM0_9BACT|nr:hypothetical protein [Pontiella sulfatireligans]VGO18302.1 hypothetical protein SCARR_00354 [Pontiella sulfatireligans]